MSRSRAHLWPSLLVLLILALVAERAWVADDALITARTVDNLVHGYGLRWNTVERVQAYTHPLWALVLSVPMALGLNWYGSLLALGFLTTALVLATLARSPTRTSARVCALLALLGSDAFLDFSTSGLENPLTHLLLVAIVLAFPLGQFGRGALTRLVALTALLTVSRLDAILLVAPIIGFATYRACRSGLGTRQVALSISIGSLPFVGWEVFSLLYYGFPFPNTAYAKLNTGIPWFRALQGGFSYFAYTLDHDPWTLVGAALLAAGVVQFRSSERALLPLAGALLYYVYVLRIGGDFMGGRFLVAPLVLLSATVASPHVALPDRWKWQPPAAIALSAILCFVARAEPASHEVPGPLNERVQSSQDTRLRTVIARGLSRPENSSSQRGEAWRREARQLPERHNNGPRLIRHAYAIGLLGLAAGPDVHIVDHLALTDPLLARLPAAYDPMPLAGHFERMGQWSSPIPVTKKCPSRFEVCQFWRDYEASLRSGACQLADAQLCGYWRDLRLVTEGPLLSAERFRAIVRLNLARRDPRIDRRRYRNAVREYPGVKAREDTRGP